MKKTYEAPRLERIVVKRSDIITSSVTVEIETGNGVNLPGIGGLMGDD